MTKETDSKTANTGTLSVGGTLGVRSGGGAPRSTGVVVEVKKRRFTAQTTSSPAIDTPELPVEGEAARRAQALNEARKNSEIEEKRREAERAQAHELNQSREEKAAEAQRKEQEARERKEAEQALKEQEAQKQSKVEANKQAEEARAQVLAQPVPTMDTRRKKSSDGDKSGKPKGKDIAKKRGGRAAYLGGLEQRQRSMSQMRRRKKSFTTPEEPKEKIIRDVVIPEVITVQELASRMAEKVGEVVKSLMSMGQMVTQNQSIDQDTAAILVEEFGHRYSFMSSTAIEENIIEKDTKANMVARPPVVTVMGHVDHGKTTLLDALRDTNVVSGEAGGITQHIGAYQVKTKSGADVTFLDTPGHEAFTSMRARGAQVTDIVILIVAADDGIMPQTIEAIKHSRAAGVPIIVAINKIDKPDANIDKTKQELLSHDLIPEDFGGDVVCVGISALKRKGLDELVDMVMLQADMLDLKADPSRKANAVVVESRLDKGRGPVASVIVSGGTIKVGDIFVAGSIWGRVRAMVDDKGKSINVATPSMPVEVLGLQGPAEAGDDFVVVEDERQAREIASFRDRRKRELQALSKKKVTLDSFFSHIKEGEVTDLNIVIKADVQGSVEAIGESLNKLAGAEIKVSVIHGGVGVVTESDVNLAMASGALIVGFNVRANAQARTLAEREGIEIRYYSVIYSLVDEIKQAMAGMLSPDTEEKITGQAEVRQIFKINKMKIAGCYVTSGTIVRGAKARLLRDGVVIHNGEIGTLRRAKDDAKEVKESFECGMTLDKYDDIREGDIIEVYEVTETARTVADVEKAAASKKEADELKELEAELGDNSED